MISYWPYLFPPNDDAAINLLQQTAKYTALLLEIQGYRDLVSSECFHDSRRCLRKDAARLSMIISPAIIAREATVVSMIMRLLSTWLMSASISITLKMTAAGTALFRCCLKTGN